MNLNVEHVLGIRITKIQAFRFALKNSENINKKYSSLITLEKLDDIEKNPKEYFESDEEINDLFCEFTWDIQDQEFKNGLKIYPSDGKSPRSYSYKKEDNRCGIDEKNMIFGLKLGEKFFHAIKKDEDKFYLRKRYNFENKIKVSLKQYNLTLETILEYKNDLVFEYSKLINDRVSDNPRYVIILDFEDSEKILVENLCNEAKEIFNEYSLQRYINVAGSSIFTYGDKIKNYITFPERDFMYSINFNEELDNEFWKNEFQEINSFFCRYFDYFPKKYDNLTFFNIKNYQENDDFYY